MTAKPTIAIVGAGALGAAMARALRAAGYTISEVIARADAASLRRARAVARAVRARVGTVANARLEADVVWLCVPDDAIAACARQLAARREVDWRGRIVLHSSGALSSALLQPLRAHGATAASLHPMMTFVRGRARGRGTRATTSMRGVWFGVEGDARAVRMARGIARALGGTAVSVRPENKALYHALGSFSSPMVIATLALAERIGREAGLPRRVVKALMLPILQRTVDNYIANGAAAAFSGPLRRGDVSTVRAHLESLARVPGALEVYRALVRASLGTLPVGKRREIERLLR